MARPTTLPPELRTLRTRLVDAAVIALREAPFASPNIDNVDNVCDDALFEFVDRGVLDDIQPQETPAARVETGDEDLTENTWPKSDKRFRLYVHFKVPVVVGVDPTPMIEYYFGRITEILVIPEHFAGIALDITEAGNSLQAQGISDPEPGGSIFYDVDYRHGYGNLFSETGNG